MPVQEKYSSEYLVQFALCQGLWPWLFSPLPPNLFKSLKNVPKVLPHMMARQMQMEIVFGKKGESPSLHNVLVFFIPEIPFNGFGTNET